MPAQKGQQPLPSNDVASLQVVLDTEKFWPQSQSAQLQLDLVGMKQPVYLYLKKVIARDMPAKSAQALRRDLSSNRNEARFYQEFSAEMRARGVPLLQAPLVQEDFSCLDTKIDGDEEEHLREGGMLLLLECANESFMQPSACPCWQTSMQQLRRTGTYFTRHPIGCMPLAVTGCWIDVAGRNCSS